MKNSHIIPLIPLIFANAAFATTPAANPPEGYTTTASAFFKSLTLNGAFVYDADTWASSNFQDAARYTYYHPADPTAEPPFPEDTRNVILYDSTDVVPVSAADGFQILGNNNTFLVSNATLSFAWTNIRNTRVVLDNATLNIAGNPASNAPTDSWFIDGALTLTNNAALNAPLNGTIKLWGQTVNATDSSITGGISGWHAGSATLTNSIWNAQGATLFQYHGNGNYTLTLDNSKATLAPTSGTAYSGGLQLYAHSATASAPLKIELKNNSELIAGTFNENGYNLAGGAESWMGWTGTNNAKVTIDVNTGSTLILGLMNVGRGVSESQATADYAINVSGTENGRSTVAFTSLYMNLATSADATIDSYNTAFNVGDYSDVYITNLHVGNTNDSGKNPTQKNGQASVNVGSNVNFFVRGGELNIGATARLGGVAKFNINGDSTVLRTNHLYMGALESNGGTNQLLIKNTTTDSTTRNEIRTYQIALRNSTLAASAQKNEVIIDGNTYIAGSEDIGDTSFRFNIGAIEAASGTSTVTLKGDNIEFGYLFQINVGNVFSTGGESKLSIQTSDIYRDGNRRLYISDALNVNGGMGAGAMLEYVADANGFAFTSANTIFFTGTLALDFSLLTSDLTQDLLDFRDKGNSGLAAWEAFCLELVNNPTSASNLLISGLDEDTDTLAFTYNNGTLGIIYTTIPEPSTCAAILGALALAFAAYRRKRN